MAQTINYSSGLSVVSHIEIWEDTHNERAGYYRAFWTEDGAGGSPVIGCCSPGGSHNTIRAVAAEVKRMYPDEDVFRNGKKIA